ncbi:nucleotide-binding protein [Methylobacterium sp. JK268]
MKVLCIASQKGGSSKTTIAAGLAVAATQDGEHVVCIDGDPQGSLLSWGRRRHRRGLNDIVFRAVTPSEVDGLLDRIQAHGKHSLVLIDSPGQLSAAVTVLVRGSSMVLMPVRPSILDIEATSATVRSVGQMGKYFAYVLAQTDSRRPALIEETRALLSETGAVAPGSIASRAAHQTAMLEGLGVTEIGGPAGDEVAALWAWLKARMSKGT